MINKAKQKIISRENIETLCKAIARKVGLTLIAQK